MIVRELITLLGFKLEDDPAKKYDKQIDSTKQKTNALASAAKGVSTAWKIAAAAVAVGIGWVSKNIIDSTVEMEGYRTQLRAFTGDADSAAALLAELRDSTIDPLFGTGTLVEAYKGLQSVGLSADATKEMINMLGDVANGSAQSFSQLSDVMTKTAATGKVNEGTLKQMVNAGFNPLLEISRTTGKSMVVLQQELKEGKISYDMLTKSIRTATSAGGQFYQNALMQTRTLGGSIAVLKDAISSIGDAIGTGFIPYLVELLHYFIDIIKTNEKVIVSFGTNFFRSILIGIATVVVAITRMNKRLGDVGGIFGNIKPLVQEFFAFIKTVSQAVTPVILSIAEIFIRAFGPIRTFVTPILRALGVVIQDVFRTVNEMLEPVKQAITNLSDEFGWLGEKVAGLIEKIRPIVNNITAAIKAAFGPIKAFVVPIIEALKPIITDVFSMLGFALDTVGNKTNGLAGFIEKLTPLFRELGTFVGDIIGFLWQFKDVIIAIVAVYGIWNVAQMAINFAMSANPIGLIITAIGLLIFAIYELVKNWDKVAPAIMSAFRAIGDFFVGIGTAIGNFFNWLWSKITGVFSAIAAFVKNNLVNIVNVVVTILFPIAGIVMALVRLIIKHWDVIGPALKRIWEKVVSVFKTIWEKIVSIAKVIWENVVAVVQAVVDKIKAIWKGIVDFIAVLIAMVKLIIERIWNGIVAVVQTVIDKVKGVWEGLVDVVTSVVNIIRGVWQGFVDLLTPFWDWFGEKANSIWNGIVSTFQNAVGVIRGIWDGFVGFFTGAWDKIKGAFSTVAEFLGFSKVETEPAIAPSPGSSGATPVNDMIVTPEGQYSTHPDDYIMAMKNPGDLAGAAAYKAASPSNTYNNSQSSVSINVNSQITTQVPAGTSADQKAAIQRQAKEAVHNEWSQVIAGARGLIPSPEGRRAL